MYLIKDNFIFFENETLVFDFQEEFKKHGKPFDEFNSSMKCFKYCITDNKLIFAHMNIDKLSMIMFDYIDGTITFRLKHVYSMSILFKNNICIDNSYIMITRDHVLFFGVDKLNNFVGCISYKTCCFELVKYNPKYHVSYCSLLTLQSKAICNSQKLYGKAIYYCKNKVETVLVDDFGFIKHKNLHTFVVDYKPYIMYNIEFFNVYFNKVIFGYKNQSSKITYYEIQTDKFKGFLSGLINGTISFNNCTPICAYTSNYNPIDTYVSE